MCKPLFDILKKIKKNTVFYCKFDKDGHINLGTISMGKNDSVLIKMQMIRHQLASNFKKRLTHNSFLFIYLFCFVFCIILWDLCVFTRTAPSGQRSY